MIGLVRSNSLGKARDSRDAFGSKVIAIQSWYVSKSEITTHCTAGEPLIKAHFRELAIRRELVETFAHMNRAYEAAH